MPPRPRTKAPVRALASPASLKGVLTAPEAAEALAAGFERAGVDAEQAPVADGGEGTAEVLGARVLRLVGVHGAFGRDRRRPERGRDPAGRGPARRARSLEPRARRAHLGRRRLRAAARLPWRDRDDGRRRRAAGPARWALRPEHGPVRHARHAARG